MNPKNIKEINLGFNETFNIEKYVEGTRYETSKPLCQVKYNVEPGEIKTEADLDNLMDNLREFCWEQTLGLFTKRLGYEKKK